MRETEFIDQNSEKWKRLEELGASKDKDPELLGDLFMEVTNDLSYSKSFFGNRSIRLYLNNLAMNVHSSIYKSRTGIGTALKGLWFDLIPKVYREARWSVFIAALLFFGSVAIGVFSSQHDPGFVGIMLPQDYIDMTLSNMEKGDPMAVYKGMGQMDMFTFITFNNLFVAFRVFLLGVLFMIGTVAALMFEGARLGAFHYLFYENGFLQESLLTVWMHGTPEISGIVLAGAAGLELGKGLVFPGTYRRKESFLIGARRAAIMMIGLVPVFIFAGFIEGFATRYTEMSDLVRLLFILSCGSFILYYFVLMPWRRYRHLDKEYLVEQRVPDFPSHEYEMDEVKGHSQILADTFSRFSVVLSDVALPLLGIAAAYVAILFLPLRENIILFQDTSMPMTGSGFTDAIARSFMQTDKLFDLQALPFLYPLDLLFMAIVSLLALQRLSPISTVDPRSFFKPRMILALILISALLHSVFWLPVPLSFILLLLLAPVALTYLVRPLCSVPSSDPVSTSSLLSTSYVPLLVLTLVLTLTGVLFMVFFNSGITDYLLTQVLGNLFTDDEVFNVVMLSINLMFTFFTLSIIVLLHVFAAYFLVSSSMEKISAAHLSTAIDQIGVRDKAYGMLRE